MNSSAYIFGSFDNGYTQYPSDYTQSVFQQMFSNMKGHTLIGTHRDSNLIMYCYIRRLQSPQQYVGLCAVVNGLYHTNPNGLFAFFEELFTNMVVIGEILQFAKNGDIVSNVQQLYQKQNEVDRVTQMIQSELQRQESFFKPLPALNYSIASTESKAFSFDDSPADIADATSIYPWIYIFKDNGYDTSSMTTYRSILKSLHQESGDKSNQIAQLKSELSSLRNKQRNTLWVGILAFAAFILGVVVWNKVLFPSEVTKKDMGLYVYYGPMEKGEPNGTGVAIYHNNDKDGRLYYYGNFTRGKRIDNNAIMFYKDGSYFKGSMNEDKWEKGIFFDVEKEHFIGEFKNNAPWNGDWYKHVKEQTIVNGQ